MRMWLVVALACGCGPSKEACRADAEDLAQFLRSVDHGIPPRPVAVTLVMRTDALPAVDERGQPLLELDAHHVRVADMAPIDTTLDALARPLRDLRARWRERNERYTHRASDQQIVVAIDAATPWSDVVTLLRTLRDAGYTEPLIEYASPPPKAPPPPPSKVDAELDEVLKRPPADRAHDVATITTHIIRSCSTLQKVFGSVASTEGDKAGEIIAALPDALVGCKCDVDMAALRTVMYRILVNDHPASQVALTLDPGGAKLEFPATAVWRDVGPKLRAGSIDP